MTASKQQLIALMQTSFYKMPTSEIQPDLAIGSNLTHNQMGPTEAN